MSTYLWINLLSFVFPFALSFDKKVAFYKNWKSLFLGILAMMLLFIPWDVAFTYYGIWGFTEQHLSGASIFYLPIEEWLFFIAIPYACIFTHKVMQAYFPKVLKIKTPVIFLVFGGLLFLGAALINYDQFYTLSACFGVAIILFYWSVNPIQNLGSFFISYAVIIIPFLLINSWLTGSFTNEPVVWYNDAENLGFRVFTVPIEDFAYNFFMLGFVASFTEKRMLRPQRR